jgi:hypothetical protein
MYDTGGIRFMPATILLATILFGTIIAPAARQIPPLHQLTFRASHDGFAVLRVSVRESGDLPAAVALAVALDGGDDHVIVLTPGAGRSDYATVLGPLTAGAHTIALTRSTLWPSDGSVTVTAASIDEVSPADPRAVVFAHAPVLGLRADTIGTSSDLPLLMYVEDERQNGDGWLRYSVVFSNEDGGTPAAALMARWGRTTDIELIYEVELRGGRVLQARYQGPDHRMLGPASPDTRPPRLNVVTLNNMVTDRGAAAATVRLVPELETLAARSRETVMDARPWIYRVMARELATERPPGVSDARDFVYIDLRLDVAGAAAVAVGVRGSDGVTRWSDRGRPDLTVSRNGEVRIAAPAPATEAIAALVVRCDLRPDSSGAPRDGATCDVRVRQAFRLASDYQPGARAIADRRVTLTPGTSADVGVALSAASR